ncbi:hypothetical protein [Peribacillus simplex]|uniref:hypothetical protein n=1 Tax=Peribacillus simplex TaxID=1478 RepID=UPI003D2D4D07
MLKRFSLVVLTMLMATATLFVAAQNSVGENVISFDQPAAIIISIVIVVLLFLPPLILSFFDHIAVKIINAVYQSVIVLAFIGLIPIGFMVPNGSMTIIVAVLGTIVSILSLVVVLLKNPTNNEAV